MNMEPATVALLGISATLLVGLTGVIVSIFATANATHRRIDDFRAETDRRFGEMDRRFGEMDRRFEEAERQMGRLRTDFRDLRGRVDHIADSLNLGRSRVRKRA